MKCKQKKTQPSGGGKCKLHQSLLTAETDLRIINSIKEIDVSLLNITEIISNIGTYQKCSKKSKICPSYQSIPIIEWKPRLCKIIIVSTCSHFDTFEDI